MTVTPLGWDQDCSLKIREPEVPAPFWFLDPGGWSKTAAVGLYFIFPGICTLSLTHHDHLVLGELSPLILREINVQGWNLPSSAFCKPGFVDRLGLFMVSQISWTFCFMSFLDLVFSLTDKSISSILIFAPLSAAMCSAAYR
ncbi:hypothetical protein STEG23_004214 [Scotinomys teguina]